MAVDVYSENHEDMCSPRLSFSRDLDENEPSTNDSSCKLDHPFIDSAFDFAFNVDTSNTFPSSSADELFSDGKMLPSCLKIEEIQRTEMLQEELFKPCLDPPLEVRTKSLKEFLEDGTEEEEPNNLGALKSFWKFRRSNSLNCDRNQRKSLIGSWKILSRSGSTGKFLEKIVEEEEKQSTNRNSNSNNNSNLHTKLFRRFSRNNSLKCENIKSSNEISNKISTGSSKTILRRSHSTSDHYYSNSSSSSKPFKRSNSTGSAPNPANVNKLKKQQSLKQQQHQVFGNGKVLQNRKVKENFRGYSYGNSNSNSNNLRINPVLNFPSPYISRVKVDLFSFGSLFCNGTKDRKKRT